MYLSAVTTFALSIWLLLWALTGHAYVAFFVALAIILPAVAVHMVKSAARED